LLQVSDILADAAFEISDMYECFGEDGAEPIG
jgi:hypothetical protein